MGRMELAASKGSGPLAHGTSFLFYVTRECMVADVQGGAVTMGTHTLELQHSCAQQPPS